MKDMFVSKRITASQALEFGFVERRLMEILAKIDDKDSYSMQTVQITQDKDNSITPIAAFPPCGF